MNPPAADFTDMMANALLAVQNAGAAPVAAAAPVIVAPVASTPQQVVRTTIAACRPPVPAGAPPRYAGLLLDAICHGGSAATADAGCRAAIDGALADFPPEIRAYVKTHNGHFPPAGTHIVGREAIEVVAIAFARRIMRPILIDQVSRMQTTTCTPAALDAILAGLGEAAYINT